MKPTPSTPTATAARLRAVYRGLLRDLPPRSTRSPIQSWVRERIAAASTATNTTTTSTTTLAQASTATTATSTKTTSPQDQPPAAQSSQQIPPLQQQQQLPQQLPQKQKSSAAAAAATRASMMREELSQAEQTMQYLRAQRTYVALVERYNPGMGMDQKERVRLSARRVGMNLPV